MTFIGMEGYYNRAIKPSNHKAFSLSLNRENHPYICLKQKLEKPSHVPIHLDS